MTTERTLADICPEADKLLKSAEVLRTRVHALPGHYQAMLANMIPNPFRLARQIEAACDRLVELAQQRRDADAVAVRRAKECDAALARAKELEGSLKELSKQWHAACEQRDDAIREIGEEARKRGLLEAEVGRLRATLPCSHPELCMMIDNATGKHFCGWCREVEQRESEIEYLRSKLPESEW